MRRACCVRNLLSTTCANLIVVYIGIYCRRRSRKRLSLIYLVHNNTNCDTKSAFSYLSGLRFMKSSMNVNLPQLMPFIFFYLKIRTIQLSTLYSIYDCCDQDYVYWLDVFSFFFFLIEGNRNKCVNMRTRWSDGGSPSRWCCSYLAVANLRSTPFVFGPLNFARRIVQRQCKRLHVVAANKYASLTHSAITWYNKNKTNWRRTAKLVLLTCNMCSLFIFLVFRSRSPESVSHSVCVRFLLFFFLNSIHPDDAISPQRIKLEYMQCKK